MKNPAQFDLVIWPLAVVAAADDARAQGRLGAAAHLEDLSAWLINHLPELDNISDGTAAPRRIRVRKTSWKCPDCHRITHLPAYNCSTCSRMIAAHLEDLSAGLINHLPELDNISDGTATPHRFDLPGTIKDRRNAAVAKAEKYTTPPDAKPVTVHQRTWKCPVCHKRNEAPANTCFNCRTAVNLSHRRPYGQNHD